jgi:diguanylate cyclase (GGDEF)-like protein
VSDVATDTRFDERMQQGFGVESLLCIPLVWRDKVRAVLSFSADRAGVFDERAEQMGWLLGHWAGDALRIQELEALTITDPHTRAFNARYLAQRLPEEMQRTLRSGDPLSLLLIDLDHFKHINDTHGHKVGDAVLHAFVQVVRRHIRNTDVLIRRGGEEFVLLLPTTDPEQAFAVAERIRFALSTEPLELRGGLLIRQTVSIGVATWDGEESTEQLEARADHAMYRAKRRGRDRVCHGERRSLRTSGIVAMNHDGTPREPASNG